MSWLIQKFVIWYCNSAISKLSWTLEELAVAWGSEDGSKRVYTRCEPSLMKGIPNNSSLSSSSDNLVMSWGRVACYRTLPLMSCLQRWSQWLCDSCQWDKRRWQERPSEADALVPKQQLLHVYHKSKIHFLLFLLSLTWLWKSWFLCQFTISMVYVHMEAFFIVLHLSINSLTPFSNVTTTTRSKYSEVFIFLPTPM